MNLKTKINGQNMDEVYNKVFYFFRESVPDNPNYLSASRTNENVIFGSSPEFVSSTPRRKKSSSKSPIDSTTQL